MRLIFLQSSMVALVHASLPGVHVQATCTSGSLEKCVAMCKSKNYTACASACLQDCASPATRKRGFSGLLGKYFTCGDPRALNLGDSWYYNWIGNPTQYNKCKVAAGGERVAAEFVPMINGLGVAK